ncbi:MAG: immune inhibitor A [Chloroflexota bacterium]|nr:immune inhibitor A [Chloroflexota bacterium]
MLEYSTDNGATWTDAGTLITEGAYNAVLGGPENPLLGRQGWGNQNPGFPAYSHVTVDLSSLAGHSVNVRFREGSDSSGAATGWYVDEVTIVSGQQCTVTVTPAGGPSTVTRTSVVGTATITTVPSTATSTTVPGTATTTVTGTPPSATSTSRVTSTSTLTYTSTPTTVLGTATRTVTGTPPSATSTFTSTPTYTSTSTVTGTPSTPLPSSTACSIQFTDVPPGSTFYSFARCLACRGIVGGYPCGGPGEPCDPNHNAYYRPAVNVSRGQIAKIVSNSAGFSDDPGTQIYEDVAPGSPFYTFINRLTHRNVMGGYVCGGQNPETGQAEPCGDANRPYFRPGNTATRGQVSKIVSNAAGFQEDPGNTPTYADVPTTNPFYQYIQRLTNRGVMGGYACGGQNPETGEAEPCNSANQPYFRYGNRITRGQTAKIVANTFFPNCDTPAAR